VLSSAQRPQGIQEDRPEGEMGTRTGARGSSPEVYPVVPMYGFVAASFYLCGSGWDSIALETLCHPRLRMGWRWF